MAIDNWNGGHHKSRPSRARGLKRCSVLSLIVMNGRAPRGRVD